MFTGIVQEIGIVRAIKKAKQGSSFSVNTRSILKGKKLGQSIAVNGVCVSIKKIHGQNFEFDAIPETIKKTNLSELKKGSVVNLEAALQLNQEVDGHFVLGHVDTTSTVKKLTKNKKGTILEIKFPKDLQKYLAQKGYICLNGVSLTISALKKDSFEVALIPLTLKQTNLAFLKKNDKVNIEVDLVARYLNSLLHGIK